MTRSCPHMAWHSSGREVSSSFAWSKPCCSREGGQRNCCTRGYDGLRAPSAGTAPLKHGTQHRAVGGQCSAGHGVSGDSWDKPGRKMGRGWAASTGAPESEEHPRAAACKALHSLPWGGCSWTHRPTPGHRQPQRWAQITGIGAGGAPAHSQPEAAGSPQRTSRPQTTAPSACPTPPGAWMWLCRKQRSLATRRNP